MFNFKKKSRSVGPPRSYAKEVLRLDFGLTDSLSDQIAMKGLGRAMAVYVDYRMAIARCSAALDNADLTPGEAGEHIRFLQQESSAAEKMRPLLQAHLEQARVEVNQLLDTGAETAGAIQIAVGVEYGLVESADKKGAGEEKNVSQQLLETGSKKERQQLKNQKKGVREGAEELSDRLKIIGETAESAVGIDDLEKRIAHLEGTLEPELEASAKAEVVVHKEASAEFTKKMLEKQINKQVQQSNVQEGIGR